MPKTRFVINCSLPQELFVDPHPHQYLQIIVFGLEHDIKRSLDLGINFKKVTHDFDLSDCKSRFCFEVELDSKQWFQYYLQEHNAVDKLADCVRTSLIQRLGLFIL